MICRPEKAPPFLLGGGAIKGANNEEQSRIGVEALNPKP